MAQPSSNEPFSNTSASTPTPRRSASSWLPQRRRRFGGEGTELKQVERRLAEVEADFVKNLELLKREVLDKQEFRKANEARRDERVKLTGRQTELGDWLAQQHERQEAVGSLPTGVRSFLKDFQAMDVRRAKALLQTILSAAHVHKDGRIELEFRS